MVGVAGDRLGERAVDAFGDVLAPAGAGVGVAGTEMNERRRSNRSPGEPSIEGSASRSAGTRPTPAPLIDTETGRSVTGPLTATKDHGEHSY